MIAVRNRLVFLFAIPLFSIGCVCNGPASSGLEPRLGSFRGEWAADQLRLDTDIGRAIRDLHWGKLYLHREPSDESQPLQRVRAEALLDDGRTALIVGRPVGSDQVDVTVQVGRFGDHDQERAFVKKLAKILHGKPKPKRGGKFKLP